MNLAEGVGGCHQEKCCTPSTRHSYLCPWKDLYGSFFDLLVLLLLRSGIYFPVLIVKINYFTEISTTYCEEEVHGKEYMKDEQINNFFIKISLPNVGFGPPPPTWFLRSTTTRVLYIQSVRLKKEPLWEVLWIKRKTPFLCSVYCKASQTPSVHQ